MYRDVDIQVGMEIGEYFIYHNGTLEHTLVSTSIRLYTLHICITSCCSACNLGGVLPGGICLPGLPQVIIYIEYILYSTCIGIIIIMCNVFTYQRHLRALYIYTRAG